MDFQNVDKFVMESRLCIQQSAKDGLSIMTSLEYLPGDMKTGKYISLQGDKLL